MKTEVTIEKKKEAETGDIFYPGNIVESKDKRDIVMVTGEGNRDENFAGIALQSACNELWDYDNVWKKNCFRQFHGKIILETKDK